MNELDLTKTIDFEVLGDIEPTIIEILGGYQTEMLSDCSLHLVGTNLELPGFWRWLTYRGWMAREIDKKIITTLYERKLIKIHEISE